MSRELPERPSLDHLRQQAKDRLVDMRHNAPEAQLADALHRIARDYGFNTWPELKAHVERVAPSKGMAPAGRDSLAGRWAARGASLRSLGVAPPESAALEFTIVGCHVTITQWTVDQNGREVRATSSVDVDGEEHRYADTPHGIVARWSGRTLEVHTTLDGRPTSHVTYALSENGTSLTLSASTAAHDGFPAVRRHATFTRQTFR